MVIDDAFPLDFGLTEIDEEGDVSVGGSEVIETLGVVLWGQALYGF